MDDSVLTPKNRWLAGIDKSIRIACYAPWTLNHNCLPFSVGIFIASLRTYVPHLTWCCILSRGVITSTSAQSEQLFKVHCCPSHPLTQLHTAHTSAPYGYRWRELQGRISSLLFRTLVNYCRPGCTSFAGPKLKESMCWVNDSFWSTAYGRTIFPIQLEAFHFHGTDTSLLNHHASISQSHHNLD